MVDNGLPIPSRIANSGSNNVTVIDGVNIETFRARRSINIGKVDDS
jgi:hypothetical protein